MRVLFRTDASVAIGGGHVMRCLTLADALSRRGVRVGFASAAGTTDVVPALQGSGHEIMTIDNRDVASGRFGLSWAGGCDLLVVDHYGLGMGFEASCRDWARSIMVIDDCTRCVHDCDILLDPLTSETANLSDLVPADCRMLLGPNYALLHPQFAAARRATLAIRWRRRSSGKLFISFGGVDSQNMTGRFLRGLARSNVVKEIHVAIGHASPNLGEVRELAGALPQRVILHEDSSEIAHLMAAADMAVGAAGSMSWERCCLGLPAVAVAIAENQEPIARLLEGSGAAVVVSRYRDDMADEIRVQVESLLTDGPRRLRMGEAAAALCDGRGLERVLGALAPRAVAH